MKKDITRKFKSKEIVKAEQYISDGEDVKYVVIGKNDPNDRWDDTPDGPYVQGEEYKCRVNDGDWIVLRKGSRYPTVISDKNFKKMYKEKIQ